MITLLLVCIFFGVNARAYLNIDRMQLVVEIILPLNIRVISVRLNLHNKTLFYNINGGKVRQIAIKSNKNKAKKQFTKIRVNKISYSLIIGSNDDCLKGLYIANIVDYVSNFIKVISKNYIEIDKLEKFIIPNFKDDETKFVMNIIINKGIIDIIKNLFAKKQKNGEVKYANW